MNNIILALIPIFSLILIGYFFNKIKFPSSDFWPMADKLTYFVLMPILLVYKLSNANISSSNSFNFVITALICIVILFVLLLVINKIFKFDHMAFTSIVQGAIRFNTYVFLALVDSIYGNDGLVLAVLLITFAIPLINLLCITTFAIYTSNKFSFKYFYKLIFTNPLIIACFVGGMINYLDINIPIVINDTMHIISNAALPIGLISVGVGLNLKSISFSKYELSLSSLSKLIILPILLLFLGKLFHLNGIYLAILVLYGTIPTAPSSYVLARQLKGDVQLMSSIISVQTLISIFTIGFILKFIA